MEFIALDFETANSRADSACQLALVVVRAGQIVDEHCWLVRPPRLYFSPRNIGIHGIRPDHVRNAPTMQQLWQSLHSLIDGQVLVAHNAGFDIGVLVASLAAYDIACPHIEFSCTRAIAKRTWPGRARYGLKPLGNSLGIDFKHHDALEDARCCAMIALSAAQAFEADSFSSFSDFERRLRLSRGKYSLGRINGPRAIGKRPFLPTTATWLADAPQSQSPPTARVDVPPPAASPFHRARPTGRGGIDPLAIVDAAGGSQPLAGKSIACLGTLRGLSSDETRQLIEALGGEYIPSLSGEQRRRIDYVVACGGTLIDEAKESLTDQPQADDMAARPIRVLSERQFLSLLPAGKAAVRW